MGARSGDNISGYVDPPVFQTGKWSTHSVLGVGGIPSHGHGTTTASCRLIGEAGRLGVKRAAEDARRDPTSVSTDNNTQPLNRQKRFEFDDEMSAAEPRWVKVNAGGVRVENLKKFGGPWLALHRIRTLQLASFLSPLRIK